MPTGQHRAQSARHNPFPPIYPYPAGACSIRATRHRAHCARRTHGMRRTVQALHNRRDIFPPTGKQASAIGPPCMDLGHPAHALQAVCTIFPSSLIGIRSYAPLCVTILKDHASVSGGLLRRPAPRGWTQSSASLCCQSRGGPLRVAYPRSVGTGKVYVIGPPARRRTAHPLPAAVRR